MPTSDSADTPRSPVKLRLAALSKAFGAFAAVDNVSLDLEEGQLLALLGPSGCGKTTTLRMVAGLERPTAGEIILDGRTLASGTSSIEPEKRGLGMVFQTYALWPHMNVFENAAYGLRRAGRPVEDIRQRVGEVLEIVGMSGYEKRPATNLSGGQQQRVAVARALATRPKVLLFDEPLSNLDAVLRESMRFEIRSLQQRQNITSIYVTHSQDEALSIADVVGVMKDGRLQQLGTPQEVYGYPRNRFVAGFVGLANVVSGTVEGADANAFRVRLGNGVSCSVERRHNVAAERVQPGAGVSLAIRPEAIAIVPEAPAPTDSHIIVEGRISTTTFSGNLIDYFVDTADFGGRVRVQSFPPAVAGPGSPVTLRFAAASLVLLED